MRAYPVDGSDVGSRLKLLQSVATTKIRTTASCLLTANVIGLFCLLLFFPAFTFAQLGSAQSPGPLTWLTNAQQIRGLDPDEAQKGFPVHLHGIVTYYDAPLHNLFLQDATAGIFVLVAPNASTNIAAGREIEVEGVSDKGDYAPIVKASAIRVLGKGQLPAPHQVSIDQLFTGLEDSQWVEVSGVDRSTTVFDRRHYLTLSMHGQQIMVYVENVGESGSPNSLNNLINTTVRVRGVCYSRYNMRGQLRMPWVAVSSMADVVVESPSPGQPKEVSIASLARFNSSGYYGNRVQVSGVVTLQKADGSLFIQNQGYGLCVQLAQPVKLVPGDRVMVSGYTSLGQYVPVLEDATAQFLGHGQPPSPISTDLETLLNSPEDFEGVLVHLKTSLINLIESPTRQTLVLQSSNSIFTASIESSQTGDESGALKIGSELALTGVFVAQPPSKWIPGVTRSRESVVSNLPYSPPESIQILLRSYGDIAVVRQPSWWTLARMLRLLGIMTLVLLGGLAWVVMLDRRVRQQTQIIHEKVRREGVLEERDRIAREFHDTLEQELAAITIQLDAVEAQSRESSQTVRRQLELARSMSRRSLSEARRSVWDLRSHLLENCDLVTALKEISLPLSRGTGIAITVASSGTPTKLPALTEHNLLRIGQEALANALKHSHAKKIVVGVNYETKQVQLSIRDDGTGFDIQTAGSANGGHFGLLDMRERAEKIGGRFCLNSRRGSGTEILVTVHTMTVASPAEKYSPSRDNPTAPVSGKVC